MLLFLCLWQADMVLLPGESPMADFSTGTSEKPSRSKAPQDALRDDYLCMLLTGQENCRDASKTQTSLLFNLPYHSRASGPFLRPHYWSLGPREENVRHNTRKKMSLFIQKLIFFKDSEHH